LTDTQNILTLNTRYLISLDWAELMGGTILIACPYV
jgi:hypothetical protein